LDGVAKFATPLAARGVKNGVEDNFAALKRILEIPG
jgi:hypothetical protein